MRPILTDDSGAYCPNCKGRQFIPRKTVKGYLAGGLLFAPQRLRCLTCGRTFKFAGQHGGGVEWKIALPAIVLVAILLTVGQNALAVVVLFLYLGVVFVRRLRD